MKQQKMRPCGAVLPDGAAVCARHVARDEICALVVAARERCWRESFGGRDAVTDGSRRALVPPLRGGLDHSSPRTVVGWVGEEVEQVMRDIEGDVRANG